MSAPPAPDPAPSPGDAARSVVAHSQWRHLALCAAPFLAVAAFVTWRVAVDHAGPRRHPPVWVTDLFADRWAVYRFMGVISGVMGVLAVARTRVAVRRWLASLTGTRVAAVALGGAVLIAGVNYGYLARVTRQASFVQQHDSYHYTLGPKYIEETGYDHFYECVLLAEPGRRIRAKRKVRDLHSYYNTRAGKVRKKLARDDHCTPGFTPQRWAAFEADLAAIWEHGKGRKRVPAGAVRDNGYNGTPFHAQLMSAWANAAGELDIATVARMALVDFWGLCALGVCLCMVFGWRVGMVCAVFMFTNAADRYDIVGGSPGRYLWFVVLGLGVCALAARRWFAGGALLTAAAGLVAFPFLFWLGALFSVAATFARGLRDRALRFVAGTVAACVLVLGTSWLRAGSLQPYRDWLDNMAMHTHGVRAKAFEGLPLTTTPGFGLGLKFALIDARLDAHKGGRKAKLMAYRDIRGRYQVLGGLLAWVAACVATVLRAAAATCLFGVTVFYALQGTVGYYFVCASLLPLCLVAGWRASDTSRPHEAVPPIELHGRDNRRALVHAPWLCAGLESLLWTVNAFALWRLADTQQRFMMYNVDLSWGLGAWLLLTMAAFAWLAWPRVQPMTTGD